LARNIVLALTVIGASIVLLATGRLGAVIVATPDQLWLNEFPRLVSFSDAASPVVQSRAALVSQYLNDPALFYSSIDRCASAQGSETRPANSAATDRTRDCLAAIDVALRANPSSGELWLLKATVLIRTGDLGADMIDALRGSYRTTPREGWIASERVLVGLRLYPLLPADIRNQVAADLRIVLTEAALAQPLIDAYPRDLALRRAAKDALNTLPSDLLEKFVRLVSSSNF
jgi:hypothetical protein